ncbi:MAG: ABC transporter substrate-binding protein [Azospirillum sp.]|nr:ABC transporter substrate-binding protein [Azospirillum sp.]MCZ8124375.1 ABC transporter substrate-binding protein [Magnetospirillum sp.]
MRFTRLGFAFAGAAMVAASLAAPTPALAQANEQFIPALVYRTGPFGPNGTPFADGFVDYLKMINARDGGVNGVRLTWEECETAYNTDRGVECYERLKARGPTGATAIVPLSTGITYALIERTVQDRIPLLTSGYGRSDSSDGRVFPWTFTLPATYYSQMDAIVQFIRSKEGGNLRGKKISYIYHDSAFGKEPLPVIQRLAREQGFELTEFPVPNPGVEQKAIWLRIGRQIRPNYVIMWGWGIMNPTAIQEAAAVGFPRDRFIGVWWAGSEQDVTPPGDLARGYLAANFHGTGKDFKFIRDIENLVHKPGQATGDGKHLGTVLYNRGAVNAAMIVEAVRTAQERHGRGRPMTGAQVRDGFEALNLDPQRLAAMGFEGFMPPLRLSCADHEGGGIVRIQQWDGRKWNWASDWIEPNRAMIREMYEATSMQYAREKNITPRDCARQS